MVESTTISPTLNSTSNPKRSITQNGAETNNATEAKNCIDNVTLKSLPKGKYTLVGIDIDTTGRRLIDEIIQLAAFTPSDHYSQYIMPYMNLNPAARQRHQVHVITIGYYRMLKSIQTLKVIKSKSEYAALKNFLDWLEALRAKDNSSQGIILVYYEKRKFIPYLVLESLKKYNLLDRFLNTVKSFANGLNLTKTNADESLQQFSLRKLSMHLKGDSLSTIKSELNNNNASVPAAVAAPEAGKTSPTNQKRKKLQKYLHRHDLEAFDGNAKFRAQLVYEVTWQLINQDRKGPLEYTNANNEMLAALQPHARPVECDISELQAQNENFERQNSFRPVFLNYFKTTLYHRLRAVQFRIVLADHLYDLQAFSVIWSEKKRDGIAEVLQKIDELKPEDKTELADLFDSYFDPDKKTIKPFAQRNRRRNKHESDVTENNENGGAGGDKQQGVVSSVNLPDSTTKSPKNQRGRQTLQSLNAKQFTKRPASNNLTDIGNQANNATTTLVTPTASN